MKVRALGENVRGGGASQWESGGPHACMHLLRAEALTCCSNSPFALFVGFTSFACLGLVGTFLINSSMFGSQGLNFSL
jgi:hypothetical protein